MKLTSLIAGVLALACAALAHAGTPIVPSPHLIIQGKDYGAPYRMLDDPKGLISGSRFTNVSGKPSRGGFRTSGDASDIVFQNVTLSLTGIQTGSAQPAGIELQGTTHNVRIDNLRGSGFKMSPVADHYLEGDVVVTEAGVRDITVSNSYASDSSDACFDLKGWVTLINDVLERCNRPLRDWTHVTVHGTLTINDPVHYGGNGGSTFVWLGGAAVLDGSDATLILAGYAPYVFDCAGSGSVKFRDHDFRKLDPRTKLVYGPCKVDVGPQIVDPPPAPAVVAPTYDYTSATALPDSNHDNLVTVVSDPTLLKLFGKGAVLKLVASDASGFHYVRQQ